MSYALLAQLPPEYGLYTSFVGTLVYWLFATSKDVTIGVSNPPLFRRTTPTTPNREDTS